MKAIYPILIFLAGLFSGHLLFNHGSAPHSEIRPEKFSLLERIKETDSARNSRLHTLHNENDQLQRQLQITNTQVVSEKQSLADQRREAGHLKDLLQHDTDRCPDQLIVEGLCLQIDSLNETTDTLIAGFENKLLLTEHLVAIRDSEIVVCNESFMKVSDLAKEQAAREAYLTEQLNLATKKERHALARSRLLGGGLAFLSGVTASILLFKK